MQIKDIQTVHSEFINWMDTELEATLEAIKKGDQFKARFKLQTMKSAIKAHRVGVKN